MDRHQEDRTQTGPSWNDVQAWLREMGKTHSKAVVVECTLLPDTAGRPTYGLWWRVVAYGRGPVGLRSEVAKGARWPHTDHRTVPALLIKLAHDLDWELTMANQEAERQAAF